MDICGYKGRKFQVNVGDYISDSDGHSGVVQYLTPFACAIITDIGTTVIVDSCDVSYAVPAGAEAA